MKRRTVLKNLTLGVGYTIATPTLLNILSSCSEKKVGWQPMFLSSEQKMVVSHLIDIILPSSDTPGALDVNVPQFFDMIFYEIEDENNHKKFNKGYSFFAERYKSMFNKNIIDAKKEQIEELFELYFNISEKEKQSVIEEQSSEIETDSGDKSSDYFVYYFLFSIRYFSLLGYFTSEKIGTEVLNYDPVPGSYLGCIPLSDVGNAWSLQ